VCTLTLLRGPWSDDGQLSCESGAPEDGSHLVPRWRLVFNRDEQHTRPPAGPPRESCRDSVRIVAPVDPLGGGTWIATSSAGLVFAVLNEYPAATLPAGLVLASRGLIIPSVMSALSIPAVRRAVSAIDARRFRPFRLVVAADEGVWEVVSDGRRLQEAAVGGGQPVMRTSSSIDAIRVRACRTALFTQLVSRASRRAQDAFHAFTWMGDPALGVCMAREDAGTVSITTVEVFADRVCMTYRPLSGDRDRFVTRLRRSS
jgi:Transport and Golgi organisation 2